MTDKRYKMNGNIRFWALVALIVERNKKKKRKKKEGNDGKEVI